ncbi:TPA: hypothetical protein ACGO1T_000853 [Streptococcus suis]
MTNNYYDTRTGKRIVQIQSVSGHLQILTADFDDNLERWDSLLEDDLIQKVHEWHYRTFLQGRFINEAVDLTQQRAKEVEELSAKIKQIFTDADAELAKIKEVSEMSQGTLVEIGEMVFSHEEKLTDIEARVHVLETRNAFGD